jgi:hypothetical protein
VICAGRGLDEVEPGLFSREEDRAFFFLLYADSEKCRARGPRSPGAWP